MKLLYSYLLINKKNKIDTAASTKIDKWTNLPQTLTQSVRNAIKWLTLTYKLNDALREKVNFFFCLIISRKCSKHSVRTGSGPERRFP